MVKKIKYVLFISLVGLALASFMVLKPGAVNGLKTVVIDPGHGGKDPGCQGSIHREKDVALAVALRLGHLLEENYKDLKVIYTRTSDVFVDLEERAQIANRSKADLFLSIHCNAAGKAVMVKDARTGKMRPKLVRNSKGRYIPLEKPNPVPYGTETYVMGLKNEEGKMKVATRENSAIFYEEDYEKKYGGFDPESEESYIIMSNYTSAYVIQSANLAVKLQDEYASKAGRIDKGVHRQSIWVLWRTSMPSVLTEIGYLTNPLEEKFLGSEKGQDYLAKAIFRGIRHYKDDLEGIKRVYTDAIETQTPLENENLAAGNQAGKKVSDDGDDPIEVVKDDGPEKAADKNKEKVDDDKFTELPLKPGQDKLGGDSARPVRDSAKTKYNAIASGSNMPARNEVVYKVQFASSDQPMNLKQIKYAAVVDPDFYKVDKVLKYTSGNFKSFKDATAHKNALREKGLSDCFVIALKNGQRLSITEALKISGD
ncbi:MAG TPA: N-acetylmuramoyl-L-alanine amidase [Bacteroidia bacterium]|nr:N-acetylmuramoyl-L-alanine amidase [Bacteroidia bacterium]